MRRRKWLWVALIVVAIVGTGWAAWVLTGPRTYLPPGTERLTKTADRGRYGVALSLDGRHAAFKHFNLKTDESVFESLNLDSREITRLAPSDGSDQGAEWLQGDHFAVVSSGSSRSGIAPTLIRYAGSQRAVTSLDGLGSIYDMVYSPQTNELYFADLFANRPKGMQFGLWALSLQTGAQRRIDSVHPSTWMTRSADGSQWVMRQVDGSNRGVSLLSEDFQLIKMLPNFNPKGNSLYVVRAALAPRGHRVACIRWRDTMRSQVLENANEHEAHATVPDWMPVPDLLGASINALESRIDVYDLDSEHWESLASLGGPCLGIAWHPNGKDLIVTGLGHLWRIPLPVHLQSPPAPGYKEPQ